MCKKLNWLPSKKTLDRNKRTLSISLLPNMMLLKTTMTNICFLGEKSKNRQKQIKSGIKRHLLSQRGKKSGCSRNKNRIQRYFEYAHTH